MKALIRNKGETVTERDGVVGIDWDTGAPLTNHAWAGGPYTLVDDYVPGVEYDVAVPDSTSESAQDPVEGAAPDTIVIDGVTYIRTS